MQQLPAALAPLAAYRQFVVYIVVPSKTRPGKNDKFPVDPATGKVDDAHNPAIWTDAQTACNVATAWGQQYGVGFVLTENDPFFFIDFDDALQVDGTWSPITNYLVSAFPGAAIEVSSSGKGLHIIGSGSHACPPHKKKNKPYNLEFYTEKRFIALTGYNAAGSASVDFSAVLPWLAENFFKKTTDGDEWGEDWTTGPCPEWRGPTDDDELLRRALKSQSAAAAFGTKASFRDLFERNIEQLAKAYPDTGRAYDESLADAALAQHLAFWTGKDCERIYRLMMRSQLVRAKWERDDYLREFTIPNAVRNQRDVLTDKEPEPVAGAHTLGDSSVPLGQDGEVAKFTSVEGSTFLSAEQQTTTFKGCVYVFDQNRILVPGGLLLKPEQFRVMFGGYNLMLDAGNEKTTRDAYEAFTQNQAYRCPRADSTTFNPMRAPGEIIRDAGRTRVNTWWPVEVPRAVGDISPFSNHLAKLLPNERDREILLAYMCACVQYKGYKIQWAPLLQGVEGNGKTMLTHCVAEAIGRRYVHWPKASKLTAQFNKWMIGNLFYAVEDIFVPGNRIDVIEELKPMITGKDLEIEGKGVDQFSANICGNFMINSNHKNAVPKTRNDRRLAFFYTAQQKREDLARDGMTPAYFANLWKWLREENGFAIVSEMLHTRPIPDEFNPTTTCQTAPITSSTTEALSQSLGSIEQEIQESVIQERAGFCEPWISSVQLTKLLEEHNAARRVPRNKYDDLMLGLGYVPHPGLPDGRLDKVVAPDNSKPRLYIKQDHPHKYLLGADLIATAYVEAQKLGFVRG